MALFCEFSSLGNESDVEQKLIYQLLIAQSPIGLSYSDVEIHTKMTLKKRVIGKDAKKKYYYPDYLIALRGFPMIVIEAKAPGIVLDDAYSEARLYAAEVNATFQSKINPCSRIIVCNGSELWAGYADHDQPKIMLKFDDISTENYLYTEFVELCSRIALIKTADKLFADAKGSSRFDTAVSLLGGKRAQNELIEANSYGSTLVFENSGVFDPKTEDDRINIVDNAYVISSKRDQHMDPMYREIRKVQLPARSIVTDIASDKPDEMIDGLSKRIFDKKLSYSLMLIIGSVGSGKTTFVRYFKRKYLEIKHPELAHQCEWVLVNMNQAPVSSNEIYSWLRERIIESIHSVRSDIDFESYEVIQKVYRREIQIFDKGIGQILGKESQRYKEELFQLLNRAQQDTQATLRALFDYIKDFDGRVPIIVLDNCDKRNPEHQLLMFEVAQWLKDEFKCVVIMPMRDDTFDRYKQQPPLDTIVKDLVFRIDPPDLLRVLQSRLNYIARMQNDRTSSTYSLEKGMRIRIAPDEQAEYFKYLLMSIRKNTWARSVFYQLSNRNIREGIQLFEDFCKSGHLKSEDVFMMRTVGEEYQLPSYKLMNALLRKNRKYYREDESNFANLFFSDFRDDFPDPFMRVDILRWLNERIGVENLKRARGFIQFADMLKDLQAIGHKREIIVRESNVLLAKGLILSETSEEAIEEQELVRISPSGQLHLKLLKNPYYLAACAEDVLYKNTDVMTRISNRLRESNYLSKASMLSTAKDMVEYLIDYRETFISNPESFLDDDKYMPLYNMKDCQSSIDTWLQDDPEIYHEIQIQGYFPIGTRTEWKIVNLQSGGILCVADNNQNIRGFLSCYEQKHEFPITLFDMLELGNIIEGEVLSYSSTYKSYQLRFVKFVRASEAVSFSGK